MAGRRQARRLVVGLAFVAIGLSLSVPAAADDLDETRDRVGQQLTAAAAQLDADTKRLAEVGSALDRSRGQLQGARDQLAETQAQLAQAEREDAHAAHQWAQAQADLDLAGAAVAAGERKVEAQRLKVGTVARSQYQQQTGMVGIGMVVTGASTGDINNRIQWSATVLSATQAEMDELQALQRSLVAARERQAQIEHETAVARQSAAANLIARQQLSADAAAQERHIASLVASNAALEASASQQVAATEAQTHALSGERTEVEARIAERNARWAAEEARLAETEAAGAQPPAAHDARTTGDGAPVAMPAEAARPSSARKPRHASSRTSSRLSALASPVDGLLTSRFGMRLHPVLKVWKLHDGTDYGAACNAPIRAAADGVVAERYYNAGYGNRLMVDHGRINGRYTTTGYNHATHYTVNVGQRVSQGQVIGYVGSTGYSTGCHLHLMTWVDGRVANPQTAGF